MIIPLLIISLFIMQEAYSDHYKIIESEPYKWPTTDIVVVAALSDSDDAKLLQIAFCVPEKMRISYDNIQVRLFRSQSEIRLRRMNEKQKYLSEFGSSIGKVANATYILEGIDNLKDCTSAEVDWDGTTHRFLFKSEQSTALDKSEESK